MSAINDFLFELAGIMLGIICILLGLFLIPAILGMLYSFFRCVFLGKCDEKDDLKK
jgi:hypothetical protein